MGIPYEQRVGETFNHLTILRITGKVNPGKRVKIMCDAQCSCGKIINARIEGIVFGTQKSCGCTRKKHKNPAFWYSLKGYERSALSRGHYFELSLEDFEKYSLMNCHYCGSEPSREIVMYGKYNYTCNGIDRVDNSKGYTLDNIVPCCKMCNFAKRDSSYDDFMSWIRKLVDKHATS